MRDTIKITKSYPIMYKFKKRVAKNEKNENEIICVYIIIL